MVPVVSVGSAYEPGVLGAALDAGMRYLQTSGSYAEQNHERTLGRLLRGRPRDSFVIASSPDLPDYRFVGGGLSEDLGTGANPAAIAPLLDGSLQRLGLESLDIYFLASINDPATALHEPYMRAYEHLKRQGKIRYTGLSTHRNEPAVIRAAVKSGFWDVVLTAYNFRQSHREEVRAAIGEAAAAGLGVVAMKTQAGVYWDSRRLRKINMKAALRWVLRDEHVHTAIPAFSNFDELAEDVEMMCDPTLSAAEDDDLRLGAAASLPGLYCQQCAACVPQCPSGVLVPDLMRGYMYAVGHERPGHAPHVLRARNPFHIPCTTCTDCVVRCSNGFDVRARARAGPPVGSLNQRARRRRAAIPGVTASAADTAARWARFFEQSAVQELQQLDRSPGLFDQGHQHAWRRRVRRDDHLLPDERHLEVIDLERHVRHLAHQPRQGTVGVVAHPLDAEGVRFMVRAGQAEVLQARHPLHGRGGGKADVVVPVGHAHGIPPRMTRHDPPTGWEWSPRGAGRSD